MNDTASPIDVEETELRREPQGQAQSDDPLQRLCDDLRPALDAARSAAADASVLVRQQARVCADKTSAYVSEQPLKAITMAAAAGAMLALLMGGRRR